MGRPVQPDSVAGQVRAAVSKARPGRFWSVGDFPDLDAALVDKALVRMSKAGDLVQVRRGAYWRGVRRAWGMSRPSVEQIVTHIAGDRGVGPAGRSAANELGLSSQVPAADTVAVPGPAPRRTASIKFVGRAARPARRDAALRSHEVAVLEVLDAWSDVIEVDPVRAADRLVRLISDGEVRAAKLAAGAATEPAASRERLRHVLRQAGRADLAASVKPAGKVTRDRALAGLVAAGPHAAVTGGGS